MNISRERWILTMENMDNQVCRREGTHTHTHSFSVTYTHMYAYKLTCLRRLWGACLSALRGEYEVSSFYASRNLKQIWKIYWSLSLWEWGWVYHMDIQNHCVFCCNDEESHAHLFFAFEFTKQVCQQVLKPLCKIGCSNISMWMASLHPTVQA